MKKFLQSHQVLFWLLLISLATFIFTYPPGYLNIDEHDYIENAKLIWQGSLKQECDPTKISQFQVSDYCIYKYNIGTSLFLLPINLLGEKFAFAISFTAFLISTIVFYLILLKQNKPKISLILFACFPAFIFFARTAFSEIYSMLFILLFYYCYLFKKPKYQILAGMCIGISLLIRPTNLLWFAVFVMIDLWQNRQSSFLYSISKVAIYMLIGFAPLLLGFMAFNNYLYLGPFKSGYSYSADLDTFKLYLLPLNFIRYFVLLNLYYPFMLLVSLFSKQKDKLAILFALLSLILMYSLSSNNTFESDIDIIIGLRFLMPGLPLLVLAYADAVERWLMGKWRGLLILALIILSIATQFFHAQYLQKNVPIWLQNHLQNQQNK